MSPLHAPATAVESAAGTGPEARIVTFGCRLNAFESEVMREHARAAGLKFETSLDEAHDKVVGALLGQTKPSALPPSPERR